MFMGAKLYIGDGIIENISLLCQQVKYFIVMIVTMKIFYVLKFIANADSQTLKYFTAETETRCLWVPSYKECVIMAAQYLVYYWDPPRAQPDVDREVPLVQTGC